MAQPRRRLTTSSIEAKPASISMEVPGSGTTLTMRVGRRCVPVLLRLMKRLAFCSPVSSPMSPARRRLRGRPEREPVRGPGAGHLHLRLDAAADGRRAGLAVATSQQSRLDCAAHLGARALGAEDRGVRDGRELHDGALGLHRRRAAQQHGGRCQRRRASGQPARAGAAGAAVHGWRPHCSLSLRLRRATKPTAAKPASSSA